MGVERAVTRWYILRQPIVNEIAALEAQLYQSRLPAEESQTAQAHVSSEHERVNDNEIVLQLQQAKARLHALGPCPKPMMG